MVKVTYKNKADKIVRLWFKTTDAACQYIKTILWNTKGYIKVAAFEVYGEYEEVDE